jgi:hypothetical protein
MADVFISYARLDADRVRPVSAALHAAGLDVWWDPSAPLEPEAAARDPKLVSAPAVLVLWSAAARNADHVLLEAVTAMGGGKLIQARMDDVSPPSPFDRLPVHDLSGWDGSPSGPAWTGLRTALQEVMTSPDAGSAFRAQPRSSSRRATYLDKPRLAPGPFLILLGALIILGGAAGWTVAPPVWRATVASRLLRTAPPEPQAASLEGPRVSVSGETPATEGNEDANLAAQAALRSADLTRPEDLRAIATGYPGTESAETARARLRAIDAQWWGEAVLRDTEEGYLAYLEVFSEDTSIPGLRAREAAERIVQLGVERSQAVSDIRRALKELGFDPGEGDDTATEEVSKALKSALAGTGRAPPDLARAAPRDLRALSDFIRSRSGRITPSASPRADAGGGADAAAWRRAIAADTAMAYEDYLESYPAGGQAVAAREALDRLREPAPFGVTGLDPDLRRAVLTARSAGVAALERAQLARARAASAEALTAGERGSLSAGGDREDAGAYRGELAEGRAEGLGVSELGAEAPAKASGALRYEGEHSAGARIGLGVTYFRSGETFAGRIGPDGGGSGVLRYGDGRRYEGEVRSGRRSGLGVMWTASGQAEGAGRWRDDDLTVARGGEASREP